MCFSSVPGAVWSAWCVLGCAIPSFSLLPGPAREVCIRTFVSPNSVRCPPSSSPCSLPDWPDPHALVPGSSLVSRNLDCSSVPANPWLPPRGRHAKHQEIRKAYPWVWTVDLVAFYLTDSAWFGRCYTDIAFLSLHHVCGEKKAKAS